MKRLDSDPEKFDALELYSRVSSDHGYKIGVDGDQNDFVERVAKSLKNALNSPTMIYGKRTEAMFAHVAGAMGACKLIKQEDSGASFVSADDVAVPDYRIVTKSDQIFLVEVKNFRMRSLSQRYTMKKPYLVKLQCYADMNKVPLKFAIYFSGVNQWILLSPSSFIDGDKTVYIDFAHAMARNEMAVLGDRMICTLPPLIMSFEGDIEDERSKVDADGQALFTIKQINMTCDGNSIDNDIEQRIAFYLMRYGSWVSDGIPAEVVDGKLKSFRFVFAPEQEGEPDDQPFHSLGTLSSMISSAFHELTVENDGVVSMDVRYDPAFFNLQIPEGYKGSSLPLWQLVLQPNMEFGPQSAVMD
ncbi:hypothetical protein [Sedimentitalea todarodis]|uniref:Restriction endonuclease n=1 Tax=Sedimentitalea todarodis TaxID=1631240 RepID=A0ABU3VL60_9RHOB|nr:hypothetical protein [Sedimentitalea todarodis]MDU9006900.1 hypothetical protein [Sedimentitalea todarodis]